MSSKSRIRSVRTWSIAAIAAVAAVVAAVLVPSAANADAVSISGTVHNASGSAVSGVSIQAYNESLDLNPVLEDTVTSSSSGAFAFPNSMVSGQYALKFAATSTTFAQFLGNSATEANSEKLTLPDGSHVYIPVLLQDSGTIAGKVSKLPSGALSGYTVRAYSQATDGTWSLDRSAKTSSTGSYSITGLQPGSYRLEALDLTSAHPTYAATWSGGAATLETASTVGVLQTKTSTYNFALGKAGSVSGTVTGLFNTSSTENLGGVKVSVYQLNGSSFPYSSATPLDSPSAVTASNGTYTVSGLAPGNYTLQFTPPTVAPFSPSGTEYGSTFLGSHDDVLAADPIAVGSATALTGRDIQLVAGGSITGQVVEAATLPSIFGISDVRVELTHPGGDPDLPSERAPTVLTGSGGQIGDFSFTGLGPGNYELWVGTTLSSDPTDGSSDAWVRQKVEVGPVVSGGPPSTVQVDMTGTGGEELWPTTDPQVTPAGPGSVVGDTLTADPGVWGPDPATSYQYQWISGGEPIPGATASTYTLRPGDEGDYITVAVTASNFGWGSSTDQANSIPNIGQGTMTTATPAASITGSAVLGQSLTAHPGGWSVSGATFQYTWESSADGTNWSPLGDSNQTHVVGLGDLTGGPYIGVSIYASREGYNSATTFVSFGSTATEGILTLVTPPTVKKTATDFSLVGGTWSPTNAGSVNYKWDGYNQSGFLFETIGSTLPISSLTAGNYITVEIEHQLSGYNYTYSDPILVQTGAPSTPTGSQAMSGIPQVGVQLTAPSLTWLPTIGTISYDWQYLSGSTWKNLANGADSAYTPGATDLGRHLRVVISRTSAGWARATVISVAPSKVGIGDAPAINSQGYTGGGDTLQNATSTSWTWSIAPTKVTYQWETSAAGSAPFTKISGATASSYKVPASLLGKYLTLFESAALAGHTTGTASLGIGIVGPGLLAVVKAPTVTHVGDIYTAAGATFSPAVNIGSVKYDWYYETDQSTPHLWESDTPGTNSSDVNIASDPNAHWYVIASGLKSPYAVSPGPEILAKNGTMTPSAAITLPTTSPVGASVAPNAVTWFASNPTVTYAWEYQSGSIWKVISGATAPSFVPTATYVGRHVRVVETAKRAFYTTLSVASSSTLVASGTAPTPGIGGLAPYINGYVGIGSTLTAVPNANYWSPNIGPSFQYQWASSTDQSTWIPIPGATTSTYVIPDAAWHSLYYRVTFTATKSGYLNGTATAATTSTPVNGTISNTVAPKVTFSAGTYSVSVGTWKPAATGTAFYDWELYDPATNVSTNVSNGPTYTPLPADANKLITVNVIPGTPNYNTLGITVIAHPGPSVTSSAPVTLTGTPVVGNTLTVNEPGWVPTGPFVAVTWYRDGVATGTNINSPTYLLGTADIGHTISVAVTASVDGYGNFTGHFTASGPTNSDVVLATTVAPVVTGTAVVDTPLTVSTGTWNTAGLTFTYQWYRDDIAIPAATATTYEVAAADLNRDISVAVTAHKAFYASQSAYGQTVTGQYGAQPVYQSTSPVKVTGTVKQNDTLVASPASWNMPVQVEYQWEVFDTGLGYYIPIQSARSSSYTITYGGDVQLGAKIQVDVFAYRPGHAFDEEKSVELTIQP